MMHLLYAKFYCYNIIVQFSAILLKIFVYFSVKNVIKFTHFYTNVLLLKLLIMIFYCSKEKFKFYNHDELI